MITINNTEIRSNTYNKKATIIDLINRKIEKEKDNSIGITIVLIMINTMIASVSVALSIYNDISFIPLIFGCVAAMGTNAAAFSQSPFKYIAWACIISVLGNSLLAIYQGIMLFY